MPSKPESTDETLPFIMYALSEMNSSKNKSSNDTNMKINDSVNTIFEIDNSVNAVVECEPIDVTTVTEKNEIKVQQCLFSTVQSICNVK